MRVRWTTGLPAIVLAVVTAGCGVAPGAAGPGASDAGSAGAESAGSESAGGATPADVAGPARETAVYAALLRHHLTGWQIGGPSPRAVYVVENAVPDAADPMRQLDARDGVPIGAQVRQELAAQLTDLGPMSFVPDARAVITEDHGCPTVPGDGAVLTLAPVPAGGDRLEIGLADFRACLNASWQTYVVVRAASGWLVEGTTGQVAVA